MTLRQMIHMGLVLAAAGSAAKAAQAAPLPVEARMEQEHAVAVSVDGKLFTRYVTVSRFDKKPYLWPVIGPVSGASVTTESSEPYPHHNSLWFACDKINGIDYWHHQNVSGRIRSQGPRILEASGTRAVFEDVCLWQPETGAPALRDYRRITVRAPDERTRLIDFVITLFPLQDLVIRNTNHSLFSARMEPDLAVNAGGTMVNAEGESGEKATFGKPSLWLDCYGTRAGVTEGLAILQHPANRWHPSPWFTRDYGFMSPTPMQWLEGGQVALPAGEPVTLAYRVVVHAGDAEAAQLPKRAARYVAHTPIPATTYLMSALEEPLSALPAYDFGQSRNATRAIEDMVRLLSGDAAAKAMLSSRLLPVLDHRAATFAAKQFVCRQLSLIGGPEAVESLARILRGEDEHLASTACLALSRIPGDKAAEALRDALLRVGGRNLGAVVAALGDRRDPTAVAPLAALAAGPDEDVAQLAVAALGRIGTAEATSRLQTLWRTPGTNRAALADALIEAAECVPDGDLAAAVYRVLYAEGPRTGYRLAALQGLLARAPNGQETLLEEALRSDDPQMRRGALRLMAEAGGAGVTRLIASELEAAAGTEKEALLRLLGERGDASAASAVRAELSADEASVRATAFRALGRLGDRSDVPLLASHLPQVEAAQALARLQGDGVTEAMIRLVEKSSGEMRGALAEALGQRGDPAAAPALWALARGGDETAGRAALKSLGAVGTPAELGALLDALSNTGISPRTRQAYVGAAVALSRRLADGGAASRFALDAFAGASPAGRASLAQVLGGLREEAALEALVEAAGDSDAAVRDAAVRALAAWPADSAVPPLTEVARTTTDLTHNILALRGVARLLRASGRQLTDLKPLYDAGKAAARRDEEREALTLEIDGVLPRDLKVDSAQAYRVYPMGLVNGATWAVDRDYTFEAVPSAVLGATYIQTAMEDRSSTSADFMTFTVDEPVVVWVAYDNRCTQLPEWLAGWERHEARVQPPPSTQCSLVLFSKKVPAGKVTLGGCRAPGTSAMYVVALRKSK